MVTGHHLRRRAIHEPRTTGERVADAVAARVGSWPFILTQTALLILWVALNTVGWWTHQWDRPPFILLNLMLSFQAAYTGPIVMMSQNRQAAKDRLRDDREAEEVHELHTMNERQLEILEGQEGIDKCLARIEATLAKGEHA